MLADRHKKSCSLKHVVIGIIALGIVAILAFYLLKPSARRGHLVKHPLTQFNVRAADGEYINMGKYAGDSVLVVNVASECGYTDVNYRQLQKLQEDYAEKGLVILAFPSNQFGGQEPRSTDEIIQFAKSKYGVTFQIMAKGPVKGPNAPPLFEWLTAALNGGKDIEWNFTKFLIAPHGFPVKMFASAEEPDSMRPLIEAMLNKQQYGGKHRRGSQTVNMGKQAV